MSADQAIEISGLTKRYGDFTAVDGLDLSIEKGEIFGLLGPNGAGKTTIILMLLGLTEPTSGSCRVYGFDPIKEPLRVKRISGYLPERIGFYENITARQNLKYFARLNGIPEREADRRIDEALSRVDLSDHADSEVGTFSRGMKQRLGIANVLIKRPRVAFLDEPTQGIDPRGVHEMLELFMSLKEEGVTILLSSHLIHQVQQVCDRVGIMVGGRMTIRGAVEDLDREEGQSWVTEIEAKGITEQILDEVSKIPGVRRIERSGDIMVVECAEDLRSEMAATIIRGGASLLGLRVRERSLDEIYRRYSEGA